MAKAKGKLEAKLSSPFMKELRALLPGAEVIKHADTSLIGLPDCSVTYNTHVAWLEFKADFLDDRIEDLLGDPELLASFLMGRHTKGAETQHEKVKSMGRQGLALYVFFVNKTCVLLVEPLQGLTRKCADAHEAASLVATIMRKWPACDPPTAAYLD